MNDSTKIDMHNTISSDEAIAIIEKSVKTLIDNPSLARSLPPIMLRGAPGIGKSTIVREIADRLGIGFIDVRLANLERVDLCGLPSVNDHITEWNIPAFLPRDKKSKGILLLDEITSAPADLQVACYSLVLDRKIPNSNYEIPDGWYVLAAGNRICDRAVVKTMSSALANRFMHFEIEANAEDWRGWAVKHDLHPSVTGFIQFRPQLLFKMDNQNLEMGWPSPRSWEKVSNIISLFGDNEEVLRKTVYGLIGPAAGIEFMEFHRTAKKFDDVLEMMTNPKAKIVIPTKADEKCAFAACVSYLLWNGKSEADDKKRVSGLYRILDEMTSDFCVMIVKTAMNGNSRVNKMAAMKLIMNDKAYKSFAAKHAKAFAERHSLDK